MPNESGDLKLLANFRKVIDLVSADTDYNLRDQLLYQADNSVVNTALLAKEYVKAALGRDSQLYKQIKGLEFKRRS